MKEKRTAIHCPYPECRGPLTFVGGDDARFSVSRHFRHVQSSIARRCPSSGETKYHTMLKREIARVADASGWEPLTEVHKPLPDGGAIRIDVLCTKDNMSIAFEPQHTKQDADTYLLRTARYHELHIPVIWLTWGPIARGIVKAGDIPLLYLHLNDTPVVQGTKGRILDVIDKTQDLRHIACTSIKSVDNWNSQNIRPIPTGQAWHDMWQKHFQRKIETLSDDCDSIVARICDPEIEQYLSKNLHFPPHISELDTRIPTRGEGNHYVRFNYDTVEDAVKSILATNGDIYQGWHALKSNLENLYAQVVKANNTAQSRIAAVKAVLEQRAGTKIAYKDQVDRIKKEPHWDIQWKEDTVRELKKAFPAYAAQQLGIAFKDFNFNTLTADAWETLREDIERGDDFCYDVLKNTLCYQQYSQWKSLSNLPQLQEIFQRGGKWPDCSCDRGDIGLWRHRITNGSLRVRRLCTHCGQISDPLDGSKMHPNLKAGIPIFSTPRIARDKWHQLPRDPKRKKGLMPYRIPYPRD